MIEVQKMQRMRQQLEEELFRLQGEMESNARGAGQRAGANLDRQDLADDYTNREQRFALGDVERTRLAQIKRALKSIDLGTYGICAECGEAIPPERLEIIPYVTLCVSCQQEQDRS